MVIGVFIFPFLVDVHGKFTHSHTLHPQLWEVGIERERVRNKQKRSTQADGEKDRRV